MVEHNLAKVGVAGSNPVSRSKRRAPNRTWRIWVAKAINPNPSVNGLRSGTSAATLNPMPHDGYGYRGRDDTRRCRASEPAGKLSACRIAVHHNQGAPAGRLSRNALIESAGKPQRIDSWCPRGQNQALIRVFLAAEGTLAIANG